MCWGMPLDMTLEAYREKRRSGRSPEPTGKRRLRRTTKPHFVIQHHAASTDHYDFRLEIDGALVSWAVPKGPSINPKEKRIRSGKDESWLLVKKSDEDADGRRKPVRSRPESVLSGRTLDELS